MLQKSVKSLLLAPGPAAKSFKVKGICSIGFRVLELKVCKVSDIAL